ncbi:ATPase, partial [Priestia megaterium]
MKWYELGEKAIVEVTKTDRQHGLTHKEVKARQQQQGFNELTEGEKKPAILVFVEQFKDFMVLVLLAATLISGLLGEYIDAIAIIAIVVINGFLGFFQERKAEKSLHALKELSAPQVAAMREGKWVKLPSKELVVGDIVKFSSGDRIGADLRIMEAKSLEIEESALTGESLPVAKQIKALPGDEVPLGDQDNMAFMGTLVTRGSGTGIVVG